MRFPVMGVLPALALGAVAVTAPLSAAQSAPAALHAPARIDDIQVSETNGVVSILVKLSTQPSAASSAAKGQRLTLEIDGVALAPLAFDPAPGSLLSRVTASGKGDGNSTLILEGAAFADAATTIYRNAVLIEAKLADPSLTSAASLMPDRAAPARATDPVAQFTAPAAAPTPVSYAPPPTAPEPAHLEPATTALSVPDLPTSEPAVSAPLVAEPQQAPIVPPVAALPAPAPQLPQSLESHPVDNAPLVQLAAAPTPPAPPASPGPATRLAGINDARCTAAATELAADAWALGAMGDHALCLLDAKKPAEAANRLDQLAAFAPEDWRVSLGRAVLDQEKGDASNAVVGYRNAAMLAPDADMRAALNLAATALLRN